MGMDSPARWRWQFQHTTEQLQSSLLRLLYLCERHRRQRWLLQQRQLTHRAQLYFQLHCPNQRCHIFICRSQRLVDDHESIYHFSTHVLRYYSNADVSPPCDKRIGRAVQGWALNWGGCRHWSPHRLGSSDHCWRGSFLVLQETEEYSRRN